MRLIAFVLAAAVAFSPARADDKATGKAADVVNAAVKASGGAELLDKFKGGSMNLKGDISVQGLELEFEGTVLYFVPAKYKMKIETAVMGQQLTIEQIMNGKKMKSTLNGMEMPLDDNSREQVEDSLMDQEITQLTPLLNTKQYTIKMGDEADVDGKKANVVVAERVGDNPKTISLFFDKETNLLVKMKRKAKDDTGAEVEEESFFTDYKEVQGVQVPHKGSVKRDGKEFMKFEMSNVKLLEKVDDKEFSVDD